MLKNLPGLDIIIINWNSGEHLKNCLESIVDSSINFNYNVIVVDNNSEDNSITQLNKKNYGLLIQLKRNFGFAKACNIGVKESNSEFILFLNPDVILKPGVIEKALSILIEKPKIGIVGVKQFDKNGNLVYSCSRFLKIKYLLNDITGLSKLYPKLFKPSTIMNDWNHSVSTEVDQVMGSFMLMRRSDFLRIGGFDERFFVYYEDMDLAKRFFNNGLNSYFCSDVSIIHSGCGTTSKIKDIRLFYSLSSRLKYVKKHFNKCKYLIVIVLTYFPEFLTRIIYTLFKAKNCLEVFNVINGYILYTKWMILKRKKY